MKLSAMTVALALLTSGVAAAQDYSPGGYGPSGLERYGLRHGDIGAATGGTVGVPPSRVDQIGSLGRTPLFGDASPRGGPVGRLTEHPQTVRQVQQALAERGHGIAVDGILGPQTRMALRLYQEEHGMTADGRLDQQTLRALGYASPITPAPLD